MSFLRRAEDENDTIVIVCNFTPVPRLNYRVGLPRAGRYHEIINSDWPQFGGSGVNNQGGVQAEELPWQNCGFSAPLNLPPLGVIMLKPQD